MDKEKHKKLEDLIGKIQAITPSVLFAARADDGESILKFSGSNNDFAYLFAHLQAGALHRLMLIQTGQAGSGEGNDKKEG